MSLGKQEQEHTKVRKGELPRETSQVFNINSRCLELWLCRARVVAHD